MLTTLFRLIIATVVGVVVAGLWAGYLTDTFYAFDQRAITACLIATIITAILCGFVGGNACNASSSSSSNKATSKSAAPKAATNHSAPREKGTVKWFNVSKGFGFITRENGEDIFVHYRNIRGEGRRRLFDGQLVEFCVTDGDKGLQADDIDILKN